MAMDYKIYSEKIESGLKATKSYTKFYINFMNDGKQIRKQIDYSNKGWDKRTRIAKIKSELAKLKEKVLSSSTSINDQSTLNQIAEMYFNQRQDTNWTKELKSVYRVHIEKSLGKKKITSIRKVDIDNLRSKLLTKGASKQNENGCSPRTIRKILVQTLKPILDYAVENEIINKIPKIDIPKQPTQIKLVSNPEETFKKLFDAIMNEYTDNPFYRAFFLFIIQGRRLNEVTTLTWENIDLDNGIYHIDAENNKTKTDQLFPLSSYQKEALNELGKSKGLIFKSEITGNKIYAPKRQLAKIKEASGITDITFHKFRHILASLMATKEGMTAFTIAATLGHKDLTTASKHYITLENKKATDRMIEIMESTVGDR